MKMSNIRILFILEFQLTMFRVPSLCITDTFFNTIDSYPNIIRNLYLKILILITGVNRGQTSHKQQFFQEHHFKHVPHPFLSTHKYKLSCATLTYPLYISFCICHNGGWCHSVFPFSTGTSHLLISVCLSVCCLVSIQRKKW